ncbi:acyloxyacyl hydrolase [Geobacter pelophilus]|uniref:Acyloxyacyl hydrolase n=1 Tax=Geoanaerobacter pelophilus TaxID=60036 RepID=A0AAW4KY87_9BACT|nr:acyloxyacyl hydrolase [Geoanaerobacter pelophilus]MBT0663329.1 acyloxyacyl hydrolase [Geoanaerobacter pelophilus]
MVKLKLSAVSTIFLLLCAVMPSYAADPATASGEYAVLGGYGITHRGFGATVTQVQTVDAILRYGYFLSDEVAKGSLVQGRHELLVELPLHLTVDPRTRIMTGLYLLGSWKFTGLSEQKLYPYAFAGGGPLYNDLGLATQGTRLNYSYQGGVGMQYLLRPGVAVIGEYRYHHISNAGTAEPNEPLNSSKILLGISKQF